jgi:hypothetical protein
VFFLIILFNDDFSTAWYIASTERMTVNDELRRPWKGMVAAYFKVLSHHHYPGGS